MDPVQRSVHCACTARALRVHCTHPRTSARARVAPRCLRACVRESVRARVSDTETVCYPAFITASQPHKVDATRATQAFRNARPQLDLSRRGPAARFTPRATQRRFAMLVHNWTCPGVGPRRVSHLHSDKPRKVDAKGPPSVSQCSSTTGLVQAWARLAPASDKPRKVDAKGPQLDLSRRGPAARLAHAPSSTEQQPVQRPSPLRRHGSALRERLGAHHCPQRWPGHKACHPSTPCSSDASRSTALSSPCLPLASILLSVLGAFQIWYSGMDFNSTLFKFAKRLPMDQRVSNS